MATFALLILPLLIAWRGFQVKPGEPALLAGGEEVVVLLHGLARTRRSMRRLEKHLKTAGYRVINLSYPANKLTVEESAAGSLAATIARCCRDSGVTVHFVTHSIGGLVVRVYLRQQPLPNLGRVVMLSPPNQGTELADHLKDNRLFRALNGPAGIQMTTDDDGLPRNLGPVDFDLGVIAGNRSLYPHFSRRIPGPDDGVIAVERTKVDGMTAFLEVPSSHPFIMYRKEVIKEVIHFLREGSFSRQTRAFGESE